jgi:hypothetical protein
MFGDYPHSMNDSGYIPEDCQQDIEPEMWFDPDGQENP